MKSSSRASHLRNRRHHFPLLVLAICAALTGPGRLVAAEQPNILFIFADDQCFDTVRSLGNSEIKTPTLDSLVQRGTTFTHAYNQGGWHGAVCVASRTMLVTGRNLWHAREAESQLGQTWVPQRRLWPQLLESAGYETFFTGKWHVKADANRVFQTARHIRGGMPAQTPAGYDRPHEGQPDPWKPWDPSFGGFWEGGKHWSEVVADDACDYLTAAANTDAPFFMYIAFNAPHDPRQSPKSYVDMYPLDQISVPKNFQPLYPFDIGSNRIRDEKLAPFPRTEYAVQVNRQEYYAIITHMDAQIDRILQRLKSTGQLDNTYIIFTADHGLACGQHGLLGKQNMHDHSVRVPLVVVGPQVRANQKVSERVYLQDVMPTSLELAGADVPEHVEFQSLWPAIQGNTAARRAIYGAYTHTQRMVTRDEFKLIVYPQVKRFQLYHIAQDPLELQDLSEDPRYGLRAKSLFRELLQLQQETGDELELSRAFPQLTDS